MNKQRCTFCESENVTLEIKCRHASLADRTDFSYSATIRSCKDCGTITEAEEESKVDFALAHTNAKKQSIEAICAHLSDEGVTMAYVERAFGLSQRTISRWKSQGCSAAAMALLNLVDSMPWLTKIAEMKFDPASVDREVFMQAGKSFLKTAEKNNFLADIQLHQTNDQLNVWARVQNLNLIYGNVVPTGGTGMMEMLEVPSSLEGAKKLA